ncbi:MAG: DUF1801 domain-containing protein [Deltaproteobacteria bacterium]|jgi:hypothetical protein|nr:DUF1801 domain-containing protein [Deltaproteobacteria bacterium]
MAEPKTQATTKSAAAFFATIKDGQKRQDAETVAAMMANVTGAPPVMWGTNMVGFGSFQYKGSSGPERSWPRLALSPRAQNLTIYLMAGFEDLGPLLKKLGPHQTGKSCLYVKRLSELDPGVLRAMLEKAAQAPLGLERSAGSGSDPKVVKKKAAATRAPAKGKAATKKKAAPKKAAAKKAEPKMAAPKKAAAKKKAAPKKR